MTLFKKIMYCIFVIMSVLIFQSCTKETIFNKFEIENKLNAEVLSANLSDVGFPNFGFIICKNSLVFADSKSDFWIKIIDLETCKLIYELGKKGRGPNEVNFVYNLSNIPGSDNLFYINDAPNKQLLVFNIDSIISGKKRPSEKIILPKENMIRSIIPLKNKYFLSEDFNSKEYSLALYDKNFIKLSEGLIYPQEIIESLKPLNTELWHAAFNPAVKIQPAGRKFCTCLMNTDFIEIFSFKGDKIETVFRTYSYLPDYRISTPNRYSYSRIRGGILNCSVTDNYIYILAHNHSEILKPDDFKEGGYYIYVFDWVGTPVMILELDRPIFHFVVDNQDESLYAFTYGEIDLKLIKYDLQFEGLF